MNKTEAEYDAVLRTLLYTGSILWYKFEGIKLALASNTTLTVDFAVLTADGVLEMHDAKGGRGVYMEDAKVKMKVAASLYPFRFKVAFKRKKSEGGGFEIEEVGPGD